MSQYVNPFSKPAPGGFGIDHMVTYDAQSRIEMVRAFNPSQLRAAIALPGVQKTVSDAARRRLKKLTGEVR